MQKEKERKVSAFYTCSSLPRAGIWDSTILVDMKSIYTGKDAKTLSWRFFMKVSRRLKVYCLQAAYNRCFDFNISFRIIWRPCYRHENRNMLVKLRLHTFVRFLNRLRVVMYLVWVADMWTVVTQIPHTIPVGVYLVSSSFQFDTLVNGVSNPYNAFWKHVSDTIFSVL